MEINAWRQIPLLGISAGKIYAASDASGQSTEKSTARQHPGGWGWTIWQSDGSSLDTMGMFDARLQPLHIFLKELFTVTTLIEHLCKAHPGHTLVIAVDNTAAIGAINCRHSSNKIANEFIRRLNAALESSKCDLDITPVRSEDNAADAPSRGKFPDVTAVARCMSLMLRHEQGFTRVELPTKSHPEFTGQLRHMDATEAVDDTVSCLVEDLHFEFQMDGLGVADEEGLVAHLPSLGTESP